MSVTGVSTRGSVLLVQVLVMSMIYLLKPNRWVPCYIIILKKIRSIGFKKPIDLIFLPIFLLHFTFFLWMQLLQSQTKPWTVASFSPIIPIQWWFACSKSTKRKFDIINCCNTETGEPNRGEVFCFWGCPETLVEAVDLCSHFNQFLVYWSPA